MNSYSVLDITAGASPSEIRAAFKAQMMAVHPDFNAGAAPDYIKWKQITDAYQALTSPAPSTLEAPSEDTLPDVDALAAFDVETPQRSALLGFLQWLAPAVACLAAFFIALLLASTLMPSSSAFGLVAWVIAVSFSACVAWRQVPIWNAAGLGTAFGVLTAWLFLLPIAVVVAAIVVILDQDGAAK